MSGAGRFAVSRRVRLAAVLVIALSMAQPALAGPPTDQLKQRIDRVFEILTGPKKAPPEGRHATMRKIADEIFDWEETAQRSLGTHWRERTKGEQEEFVRLFADLLERSYIARIERYNGERITYIGESVEGDHAVVRTRILTPQGSEIPVNYRMARRAAGEWKIYDVEIEGVSLVANYRSQFNSILQRSSYGALVARLKSKAGESEFEPPSGSPRAGRSR